LQPLTNAPSSQRFFLVLDADAAQFDEKQEASLRLSLVEYLNKSQGLAFSVTDITTKVLSGSVNVEVSLKRSANLNRLFDDINSKRFVPLAGINVLSIGYGPAGMPVGACFGNSTWDGRACNCGNKRSGDACEYIDCDYSVTLPSCPASNASHILGLAVTLNSGKQFRNATARLSLEDVPGAVSGSASSYSVYVGKDCWPKINSASQVATAKISASKYIAEFGLGWVDGGPPLKTDFFVALKPSSQSSLSNACKLLVGVKLKAQNSAISCDKLVVLPTTSKPAELCGGGEVLVPEIASNDGFGRWWHILLIVLAILAAIGAVVAFVFLNKRRADTGSGRATAAGGLPKAEPAASAPLREEARLQARLADTTQAPKGIMKAKGAEPLEHMAAVGAQSERESVENRQQPVYLKPSAPNVGIAAVPTNDREENEPEKPLGSSEQEPISHEDWERAENEISEQQQQHIALSNGSRADGSERHVPTAQAAMHADKVPVVNPNWEDDSDSEDDEPRDSVHLGLATFNEYGEDAAGNELITPHVALTVAAVKVRILAVPSHATHACTAAAITWPQQSHQNPMDRIGAWQDRSLAHEAVPSAAAFGPEVLYLAVAVVRTKDVLAGGDQSV
jgi:hypothetical protein